MAVNRHNDCESFKAQTEQAVLADAARELFCCLGLFMYILYMFMYILYILRLGLILSKADFSKTKEIPKQRDKSRFLHAQSKSALLSPFGTSSIATSGTDGPVLFSSCVEKLYIGTNKNSLVVPRVASIFLLTLEDSFMKSELILGCLF